MWKPADLTSWRHTQHRSRSTMGQLPTCSKMSGVPRSSSNMPPASPNASPSASSALMHCVYETCSPAASAIFAVSSRSSTSIGGGFGPRLIRRVRYGFSGFPDRRKTVSGLSTAVRLASRRYSSPARTPLRIAPAHSLSSAFSGAYVATLCCRGGSSVALIHTKGLLLPDESRDGSAWHTMRRTLSWSIFKIVFIAALASPSESKWRTMTSSGTARPWNTSHAQKRRPSSKPSAGSAASKAKPRVTRLK
mmetsp:Transcript_23588/g.73076  ORF Transcript_23588/g.73076 Transcript_23588/m.73076 type:complete len:249 (+) Transcript_23588:360-1106(+)